MVNILLHRKKIPLKIWLAGTASISMHQSITLLFQFHRAAMWESGGSSKKMNISIINGSPKSGESTSGLLIKYLLQETGESKCAGVQMFLASNRVGRNSKQ